MNEISNERTISVVALEIRALTQQAQQMALSYIIEIGRRLVEAKAMVPHGEWGDWLRDEVDYSQSTANNFMRIFDEYGSDQVSFFGEAKSQTLGNLSYTKALKLLALPADEREEFIETHDVETLSTRELDKLIKERDEAQRRADEAVAEAEKLKSDKDKLYEEYKKAEHEITQYDIDLNNLKKELKELQSRPIEVAVQEPDPKAIEKAKKEGIKEAMDKAQKATETALKKKEDELKGKIAEAEEKKAEAENRLSAMQAERDAAIAKASEVEKKLAVADPDTTQFKIYFEEAQGCLNKLVGLLLKAEPERREKLQKAMEAMLAQYSEKIKAGA